MKQEQQQQKKTVESLDHITSQPQINEFKKVSYFCYR